MSIKPNIYMPTPEEDAEINAGIAADPNALELDDAWFAKARPASEALPPELFNALKSARVRGPQKAPTKERITIRLSHDVLERFRSSGEGWQTRIDVALKEWLETHNLV